MSNLTPRDCPENFILINNICVRIFNEPLTWYEAHTHCTSMGFSLALIDNFELEKQLNKALFNDDDESVTSSLYNENSSQPKSSSSAIVKKFWIGMRHLNHTNWFDSKNEMIKFRVDEANWWPWLIVDSSSYNQGSCVAKRRNSFVLEDCYKRMPFACQYRIPASKLERKSSVEMKCGLSSDAFAEHLTVPATSTNSAKSSHLVASKITPTPTATLKPSPIMTVLHASESGNDTQNLRATEQQQSFDIHGDNLPVKNPVLATKTNTDSSELFDFLIHSRL